MSPPRHDIEQSSKSYILSEVFPTVLAHCAPLGRRLPEKFWVSDTTLSAIELRNWIHAKVNRCGRALKSLVENFEGGIAVAEKALRGGWYALLRSSGVL